MPWNNQSGDKETGPEKPRGPWGHGPENKGGSRLDIEALLRRGQDSLRRFLPSGRLTAGTLGVIALAIFALWIASGVYFVRPDEVGVVLRFGAVSAISDSGMRYHLPWPIEIAYTPKVKNENKISIGYQPAETGEETSQLSDVV